MEKEKKIGIPIPVIVEGKYDKMKLSQVIDADIITTDGFGIFNKKEKLALIKRLSGNGIVLLCDSDGAGGVIRRCIMSAVPKDKIFNLYIPRIEGKEKRKKAPSKEGTLGVEGMEEDLLYEMFFDLSKRLCDDGGLRYVYKEGKAITKADLYEFGLTGAHDSSAKRDALCNFFALPDGMTPNALLGALNILTDREEFVKAASSLTVTKEV